MVREAQVQVRRRGLRAGGLTGHRKVAGRVRTAKVAAREKLPALTQKEGMTRAGAGLHDSPLCERRDDSGGVAMPARAVPDRARLAPSPRIGRAAVGDREALWP